MQPFTVSITATDNHPPIVSIGSDLVVSWADLDDAFSITRVIWWFEIV